MKTLIDFDINDSCVIDHSVDHDIFTVRPQRRTPEKVELKERDIPETQIQIVEI